MQRLFPVAQVAASVPVVMETHWSEWIGPIPAKSKVVWMLVLCFSLMSCAEGREPRPGTREISVQIHEGTNLSFDLSPDGQSIVLGLVGQLWQLPVTGGNATALTDAVLDTAEAHEPRWSPDGTRVLFWRGFAGGQLSPLWMLSPESGSTRALVADTIRLIDPAWHPNSEMVAVVHSESRIAPNDRLYLYNVVTGALTLVPAQGLPEAPRNRLRMPAWSPDGSSIAVVVGAAEGPIWEVDVETGDAARLTTEGVRGAHPVYSPDGASIAYVASDADGNAQLWVQRPGAPERRQLTETDASATRLTRTFGRAVWTSDGAHLVFARAGRLWAVASDGGAPTEIPFTANVRFSQERPDLPPLQFPAQGNEQPARGFTGIALAPNSDRIALIALDSLWLVTLEGQASAIAGVGENASGLAWSPDGQVLAWSAGRNGEEDLYATDVETGVTEQLTALPGQESRPAWAPDGRRLAFLHALPRGRGTVGRLRVTAVDGTPTERIDQTVDLGPAPGASRYTPLNLVPHWSSDGSSVFLATFGGQVVVAPLQGARRTLRLPAAASSVRWLSDDSVVFLLENRLHTAALGSDSSTIAEGEQLTGDVALYPAVARDGGLLFVSSDGLRLRRPTGATERLGWPVRFRTPTSEDVVIRNVRLVEAEGSVSELSDIVLAHGRIERIAPAGAVQAAVGTETVDAEGRFVIPGLIDLHTHASDQAQLRGALYFGVTTVRDLGNPIARVAAWRDAVAAGTMPGPRIVLGGFQFAPGCVAWGGGWCMFTEFVQHPSDDSLATSGLALAQAFGATTVKLYQPQSLSGARRFIGMAHRLGLRVTGHYGHNLPLLAAGMDGEEHTGMFGPVHQDVAALAAAAGLVMTPTMVPFQWGPAVAADTAVFSSPDLAPFTDPATRRVYSGPAFSAAAVPSVVQSNLDHRETVRRLHGAGVIIGAGTDLMAPPWAVHGELEELVASGLTPREALSAATSTAARILGAEQEIGTLSPGSIADLLILEADPLTDIRNTRQIWAVIQGGRIVNRERLIRRDP